MFFLLLFFFFFFVHFIYYRKQLTAEGHDVIHLTKRPVIQIVFGAKGSVWAVHKEPNDIGDHCTRIINYYISFGMQFAI